VYSAEEYFPASVTRRVIWNRAYVAIVAIPLIAKWVSGTPAVSGHSDPLCHAVSSAPNIWNPHVHLPPEQLWNCQGRSCITGLIWFLPLWIFERWALAEVRKQFTRTSAVPEVSGVQPRCSVCGWSYRVPPAAGSVTTGCRCSGTCEIFLSSDGARHKRDTHYILRRWKFPHKIFLLMSSLAVMRLEARHGLSATVFCV
jgi:hypothetical protein